MVEAVVTVQMSDDIFDTQKIKVKVPQGTKFLKNRTYLLEDIRMYESNLKAYENCDYDSIVFSETLKNYTAEGVISTMTFDSSGNKSDALVEISPKHTAYFNITKESHSTTDGIEVGDEITVKVKPSISGYLLASMSDAVLDVKFHELMDSIETETPHEGKIVELIHGGYWVDVSGIRCFMPGSLAGLNKLWDFDSLVGKTMYFMPISYSDEKGTLIVSHRTYLKTLVPTEIENLRKNIKNKITGIVTGSTNFGIFAEFNDCLTGLIPIDECDKETIEALNNREIKPGYKISFWVKDLISDTKIILSQAGPYRDIWDEMGEKYKPMMITKGTVTKLTNYGAFVELEPGISGLIHKTKLKDITLRKGDQINVKIQSINNQDRRIVIILAN